MYLNIFLELTSLMDGLIDSLFMCNTRAYLFNLT